MITLFFRDWGSEKTNSRWTRTPPRVKVCASWPPCVRRRLHGPPSANFHASGRPDPIEAFRRVKVGERYATPKSISTISRMSKLPRTGIVKSLT
jgi:hypothetical protein